MKILLVADSHGKRPLNFVRQMMDRKIEQVVFLGDYDTPEVLKDLIEIDLRKKFIVGNHDFHYVYGIGIEGHMMENTDVGYTNLWGKNPEEKKFILDAVCGKILNAGLTLEEEIEEGIKIAYSHGGIVDEINSKQKIIDSLWQRAKYPEDVKINFEKMAEKNYKILFRGHDHEHSTIVLNGSNGLMGKSIENKIKLFNGNRYIVSVGSFYYGDYAIFDSTTREIEYRNRGDD